MERETHMTSYTLTLDFDIQPEMTIGEFNEFLSQYNFTVSHYDPFGAGGGNPELTLVTDNLDNFKNFLLAEYCDSDDLDFYLESVSIK